MKPINTKLHGLFDYFIGVFMVISPWIFDFAHIKVAHTLPVILGIMVLVTSIFTNYEFGVFRSVNVRTHLTMDLITGIFLAASPWIFAFGDEIYLPHLTFGTLIVFAALFTEKASHAIGHAPGKLRQH
jgi:hypothetical protein